MDLRSQPRLKPRLTVESMLPSPKYSSEIHGITEVLDLILCVFERLNNINIKTEIRMCTIGKHRTLVIIKSFGTIYDMN